MLSQIKSTKIILEKIIKKTISRNTVAIHSVLWEKLQRFPYMI
jgi:hypothetical protein